MNAVLDARADDDQRRLAPLPTPLPPPLPAAVHQTGLSASVMLLPLRLFLAAGWLRAGAEKLIDRRWWSGAKLHAFLDEQHEQAIPFFRPIIDHAIAPGATVVAFVVMVTQLLCGLAIGTGIKLRLAVRWAFVLNTTFILAGRVNPSAFYLVMETVLLFAIADGTIGAQRTTPSRRSLVAAATSGALAVVFVPYIRTIEPAKVIEDPAMMLTFLGVVIACTFVARRAAHPAFAHSRLGRTWVGHLEPWSSAARPPLDRRLPRRSRCP